jgi:hypothetical protein
MTELPETPTPRPKPGRLEVRGRRTASRPPPGVVLGHSMSVFRDGTHSVFALERIFKVSSPN